LNIEVKKWRVSWFDYGFFGDQFKFDFDDSGWFESEIPIEVNDLLHRKGLIKDPFFEKFNLDREWVERVDWWFRAWVYVDESLKGKRVRLVFSKIDTFAEVWVNEKLVATHEDMFLPLIVDVTDVIRFGEKNLIVVRLASPWYETYRRIKRFTDINMGNFPRVFVRKAQYQYEWDWAAKFLTTGILGDVFLEFLEEPVIRYVFARVSSLGDNVARLKISVEIEAFSEAEGKVVVKGKCKDSEFSIDKSISLKKGMNQIDFELDVSNPKLWWPHGYGEQNLYSLEANLYIDGKEVSKWTGRFGIRTVELVTEGDETENRKVFYFKINGVKVFAKGANWIPMDLFITRATKDRYYKILDLTRRGNHNMLRIWGGGLVEDESFYDICDELGIMLWHDFQFACGLYPYEDEEYTELVKKEVTSIVKRLRNHPSIVLWCGNNENEAILEYYGVKFQHPIHFKIIPELLKKLDTSRPYWPSSPWGGETANSMYEGDRHNWDIYHGLQPIQKYLEDETRFMSEFGMQAAPSIYTMKKFLSHSKLWPPNDVWEYHYHNIAKMMPYVHEVGKPRNVMEYIYYSQTIQALALKLGVENCRRRKFACGGVLYWSLNAPWPNMCWETVDYYLRPKMAFWVLKRLYSPVIPIIMDEKDKLAVYLVNDLLEDVEGKLRVFLVNKDGSVRFIFEGTKRVKANANEKVLEVAKSDIGYRDEIVYALFEYKDQKVSNFHLPVRLIDLDIATAKPKLEYRFIGIEDGFDVYELTLKTDKFAILLGVEPLGDYEFDFSDNYFCLMPGEERKIVFKAKAPEGKAKVSLRAFNSLPEEYIITFRH